MMRPALSALLSASALAALAACAAGEPTGSEEDAAAATQAPAGPLEAARPDDCLLLVWSDQDERDVAFDRANDFVDGGAISCATGTSPSQFEAAIAALRAAAKSGDKAQLLEQLGLPLLYIDRAGTRREISERAEVEAVFDEVFDPPMLALLQRLDLKQMSVAQDQGGFFELGAVWLVVEADGARPRLMTVNRQALDEALASARDQASRNQGSPIPFD